MLHPVRPRMMQPAVTRRPPAPPTDSRPNSRFLRDPGRDGRTVPPRPAHCPIGLTGGDSVPAVETPKTQLRTRAGRLAPAAVSIAYSVSDIVLPAAYRAAGSHRGRVLVPAVVIGARAVWARCASASSGGWRQRAVRVDGPAAALEDHCSSTPIPKPCTRRRPAPGMEPSSVIPARLNRPAHYLKPRRNGRSLIEGWFDPQTLYKIPRNPATVGLRALGRLAFLDHYRAFAEKLLASLEACTHPDAVAAADRATRLGLRTNRPRVYVVAGLGGGTGGGMFLDLAYAARHKLRQLGYGDAEVIGLFLLPAAEKGAKGPGVANTYTALRELNHFSQAETAFVASYEERDGEFSDPGPPFCRSFAVPLPPTPRQGQPDPPRDSARKAAAFLAGDLLGAARPGRRRRPAAGRPSTGRPRPPSACSARPRTSGPGRHS